MKFKSRKVDVTDSEHIPEAPADGRIQRFLHISANVPLSLAGLDHAYAACLTPAELFECLEQAIQMPPVRHVTLNAIEKHGAAEEIQKLASNTALHFLEAPRKGYAQVQAYNYCLNRLFPLMDEDAQSHVIASWLSDSYADSKKRFIAWASKKAAFGGTAEIYSYWEKTNDPIAAKHLIYDGPLEWLRDHLEAFLKADLEPWLLSRLLLRVSAVLPDVIESIREQDPITYLYLCAKTERKLCDQDAVELFFASLEEERRGLALWAIGTMGCWDALECISARSAEISKHDQDSFSAKYETMRNSSVNNEKKDLEVESCLAD